jgi:hypothetical protein
MVVSMRLTNWLPLCVPKEQRQRTLVAACGHLAQTLGLSEYRNPLKMGRLDKFDVSISVGYV